MPVIFASSLMQFPVIIAQLFGKVIRVDQISQLIILVQSMQHQSIRLGLIVYIVLLIIFAYFYTSITFNPIEVADNLKEGWWSYPRYNTW